ncbi:MAG: hypothetical protein DIZ80_02120, partial [endosymbiont of Galathealinum brachiosum]
MTIRQNLIYIFCLYFFSSSIASAAVLVAADEEYGIPDTKFLQVESPGVMKNDTLDGQQADENGAAVRLLTGVSSGTLSCPADAALKLCEDGSFEYIPNANFNGSDSFTYETYLGTDVSSPATVTLTACTGGPDIFSCWNEDSYRNKLSELGYNFFVEGFEGTVWDSVRTPDYGAIFTAPAITSKQITWTTNHTDTNGITTGSGAARTGLWGGFDPEHGFATGLAVDCDINSPPENCLPYDGLSGSGTALHGVGGYFTGYSGASIAVILDGVNQYSMGTLPDSEFYFFGVIDASVSGFSSFEFRELSGKIGQELFVFTDDFVIATTQSVPANNVPVLNPVGDQSVNENIFLNVSLSSSDLDDGDSHSFSMSGGPTGAVLYDNGDGTAAFNWTPVTGQAGSYQVSFTVTDNGIPVESDSEIITITVESVSSDVIAPVISLLGVSPVNIELGSTYNDAGATASDNIDGNLTANIITSSNVNTSEVGNYSVSYNVSDAAGNAASTVTRVVNVTADVTPPVISLLGSTPVNVELGSTYNDAGATASDNIDGNITATIITSSNININAVGNYSVTYNVSDAAGNVASQVT